MSGFSGPPPRARRVSLEESSRSKGDSWRETSLRCSEREGRHRWTGLGGKGSDVASRLLTRVRAVMAWSPL